MYLILRQVKADKEALSSYEISVTLRHSKGNTHRYCKKTGIKLSRDHNYFVYIVECADGFYYTGVTNNLDRRIDEHNEGIDSKSYTYKRRPVVLKYWLRFTNIEKAIEWEKQLKGWSRKKKEALFIDDWDEVKRLAGMRRSDRQSSSTSD